MEKKTATAAVGLTAEQGRALLLLARCTLEERFHRRPPRCGALDVQLADPAFDRTCGTFVTLHAAGRLRGCIGCLAAAESIRDGVRRNALNAAFHDSRFAPLTEGELDGVVVEVSILTEPRPLAYADGDDLLLRLRPGIDGVILNCGGCRATLLPQVWEQLPDPAAFLSHLCAKACLPPDCWRRQKPEIAVYQVQKYSEGDRE